MDLEQLKAAWEQALAASQAAPKDTALKAAADAAKEAYDAAVLAAEEQAKSGKGEGDQDVDDSKLDEKTKAYIAKLRKENATHRTKNKDLVSRFQASEEQKRAILKAAGIEVETEKPEEQVKTLTQTTQTLEFRNAILESAVHHGIVGDDLDYFEFLVTKATTELDEEEELTDEMLTEIVTKTKAKSGGGGKANSGVGGKSGGGTPPPGNSSDVSLDEFCKMSITQKSELFLKKPEVYNRLLTEARAKKRLI